MPPHTIMFVRHGEKPADHGAPHGVDQHGETDPHSLSVRGWTRAGALAVLFDNMPSDRRPGLARPQRVVATQPSASYKSKREVDTASPTAARMGVSVESSFSHHDGKAVAQDLLASDLDALVVWHHGSLPDLIALLPLANPSDVPSAWPEDRFDLVWCLTDDGSGRYAFSHIPQDLIAGDQPG